MSPLLRITETAEAGGHYRVEMAFEDGRRRLTADTRFAFALSAQDQEDLRWYLEDYLQFPFDPAPNVAARVEARIIQIGTELFKAVFQSGDDARDLWAKLRDQLNDTRVEVVTGVQEAAGIPWELLRDPKTDTPLALRAQAFVRSHTRAAQEAVLPPARASGPIRILLVICRPGGRADVPFRSVASRLLKGLSEEARAQFHLEVLRPPTFAQLGRVLRQAKAAGKPYHVVHFDGHGLYGEADDAVGTRLDPRIFRRPGKHGYLAFENADLEGNIELVDGQVLGKLLAETETPVLALNACRSAHTEAPDEDDAPNVPQTTDPAVGDSSDPHGQVRALGSLALEVMDAGVGGVVAMRYNVYVVTAAQFVADLYSSLAQGQTLGEAVTRGRKQLAEQPRREVGYAPRDLQDWPVPVVYEAAPIALFPRPRRQQALSIHLSAGEAMPSRGSLSADVPQPPDAGFFGRDETLLSLDRAFDNHKVVLLHAFAGSGKTTTAAEFARWYAQTGGVDGPVLFTSFEQYKPLSRVLDDLGRVFERALEQQGIHWQALDDAGRREEALQIMQQAPILWIWDNVEPVAGFPAGTASAWSAAEQKELADFLRAARQTKVRFLLTSRREEWKWLGDLPARIEMPPMPMRERLQLAKALADKQGRRLSEADWRSLLAFTEGNPLTITVLVRQALRRGLQSKEQIEAFMRRLREGTAAFEDDASEGRSKSLGASLQYGFAASFTEAEQKQLALLCFFQGFVDVDTLRVMGVPPDHVRAVEGMDRDAWIALLDRAAGIGLLTAYGDGYYAIHPALPWFFRRLLDRYYPAVASSDAPDTAEAACRAFVEAVGMFGSYYHDQYGDGNRGVIRALTQEEANLLHARRLAREHGWWRRVIGAMQGLNVLYDHTGRRAEWAALVKEIVPDFVDPTTGGPLPGREEEWGFVTDYRVLLAREARQWGQAERLQRLRLEFDRQRFAPALAVPPEMLTQEQRSAIRFLSVAAFQMGQILRDQAKPECVKLYEESFALMERIGDRPGAAVIALNLGHAYTDISTLRDLAQAEIWYRRSLELREERDRLGRGKCMNQLGAVAYERFREARQASKSEAELLGYLNAALQAYLEVLNLLPPDAVDDLAVTHNAFGNLYLEAGDLNRALVHYREAIRYEEAQGNLYGAASIRYNVALALMNAGRREDALAYAQAALRNFETFGDRAADKIQRTRALIARLT